VGDIPVAISFAKKTTLNEKLIATKRGQTLFMQRSIAISFAKK